MDILTMKKIKIWKTSKYVASSYFQYQSIVKISVCKYLARRDQKNGHR